MEPPQKGREGNIILIRIIWIEVKHGFKTIIFRATPASREISRRNEIFRKSVKEVTFGFKMCQSYPIQCQLSITQVEELGYDKEEAVEVVRREVRCWLIINININISISTMTRSTRKGQKGRGRRPPGFGGHHGMVAMLHGHGIHLR